jgi:hypothetical protein
MTAVPSLAIASVLIPAMILYLVLQRGNQSWGSPHLAIFNRWLRWLIVAAAAAELLRDVGGSARPWPALFAVCFLGWALVETAYHWMAIKALSVSPLPLFPRFQANPSGDEWPVSRRLLRLRERLRALGFRPGQALRAEIAPGFHVRVSVLHSADGATRLQVSFLPQPGGGMTVNLALATLLADGRRLVTDNVSLPFAGFYPEAWHVERRPLARNFDRLYARHERRLAAESAVARLPWTTEPLADLNDQQQELERLNTRLGFLHAHADREELGKLTPAARWRVWQELFLLNYLGRAVRYD